MIFLACAGLLAARCICWRWISGKPSSSVLFPEDSCECSSWTPAKSVDSKSARGLPGPSLRRRARSLFHFWPVRNYPGAGPLRGISRSNGSVARTASSLDLETEKILDVDDYILSDYRRSDGKSVNLYVAYYASQREEANHPIRRSIAFRAAAGRSPTSDR